MSLLTVKSEEHLYSLDVINAIFFSIFAELYSSLQFVLKSLYPLYLLYFLNQTF